MVSSKRPAAWRQTTIRILNICCTILTDEIRFRSLLEGENGGALPPRDSITHPEVLGDLLHQALERALADEELGGLLEAADLAECDGTRAVAVGLLQRRNSHANRP